MMIKASPIWWRALRPSGPPWWLWRRQAVLSCLWSEPWRPPDSSDPWDWYDVPVPTLYSGGHISGDPSGEDDRDHAVSIINDILAVLEYSGTSDGGPPNGAGRHYNQDTNGDGVFDGIAYDRSVGAARSAGPDGAVSIIVDVLSVLAQSGQSCGASP